MFGATYRIGALALLAIAAATPAAAGVAATVVPCPNFVLQPAPTKPAPVGGWTEVNPPANPVSITIAPTGTILFLSGRVRYMKCIYANNPNGVGYSMTGEVYSL